MLDASEDATLGEVLSEQKAFFGMSKPDFYERSKGYHRHGSTDGFRFVSQQCLANTLATCPLESRGHSDHWHMLVLFYATLEYVCGKGHELLTP